MITIGIRTKTTILTTCANIPGDSRIIPCDKPFSINKQIQIGTIESEIECNDLSSKLDDQFVAGYHIDKLTNQQKN